MPRIELGRRTRAVGAAVLGAALLTVPAAHAGTAPDRQDRVIVELSGAPGVRAQQQSLVKTARSRGLRLTSKRSFATLFNGLAVSVRQRDRAALAKLPGVVAVHPDITMRRADEPSNAVIGAPDVWKRKDPSGKKARGGGVTVAVVDTGIDYTHPDLGGGFGPRHKVVAGYDFVNGDGDPKDDNGHGTHVAGIIGGREGVAPDVTLTAYKVLDEGGTGYESDIMAGLEAATDPANPNRADVVNLSLGGPGDGTDPLGRMATRAAQQGTVVIAAAGNDGPGAQTVGTPAAADGVVAVGASASGVRVPRLSTGGRKIQADRNPASANPPSRPMTAPLVDRHAGDDLGDVKGKVVLLDRETAAAEAEKRGAIAVIIGGGDDGPQFAVDDTRFEHLVVMNADLLETRELRRELAKGAVNVRIDSRDATDELAGFSSRGPSDRFGAKPDIVAPGVEIRSTVPGGYERMSGTSMASPHVAGAAALLRQLRPKAPAGVIDGMLVGSAKKLSGLTPLEQGAGRLDLPAAADAGLVASPPSLSLGLADLSGSSVRASGTIQLTNTTGKRITTRLRAPGVRVSPASVTVPAGRTSDVKVTVSGRTPAADKDFTGWIEAAHIRVPYLLAARHLQMYASPDPSDGTSQAYIYSPTALETPPVVTVTGPDGKAADVTARLDHGNWWLAPLTGARPGTYKLAARARTGKVTITGKAAFEVTPVDARGAHWEPVGPNSQSGSVATSPAAPNQLAMTQYGDAGMWLTGDRGQNWQQLRRLPVGQRSGDGGHPVVDPRDGRRMWNAVNSSSLTGGTADPTYAGKILRTEDGGRTWTTLDFPNTAIQDLVIDATGSTLVARTGDALYVSHDHGTTWRARAIPWSSSASAIVISGPDLFAATDEGVWIVPRITGDEPGPARLAFAQADVRKIDGDGSLVVAAAFGGGIYGLRDGGATWKQLHDMRTVPQSLKIVNGDVFAGAYSEEHVGRDHGATWSTWKEPIRGAIEGDFASWPGSKDVLLSSEGAGLYTTGDGGGSYTRIGIQGATVYDLAVGSGPSLLAGTDFDVFRTTLPTGQVGARQRDWGNAMEAHFGTTVRQVAAAPGDPKVLWKTRTASAIDTFYVLRSPDGGATWNQMTKTNEVPKALLIHPADPERVYVAYWTPYEGSGLLATTDGGKTWRKLHQDQTFTALAGDPGDPERLWLGNANGLWRSDDGGQTVRKVSAEPATAIRTDQRRVIVGGTSIRVSTDNGRTFHTGDTGSLPTHITDIASTGGTLYAAAGAYTDAGLQKGGRGVLRSTDGGRTWVNVSGDLQNTSVTSLTTSPDGHWLYAGTEQGGVHRLRLH